MVIECLPNYGQIYDYEGGPINYKSVLAKGICRLSLWRLTPVLLQLLACNVS